MFTSAARKRPPHERAVLEKEELDEEALEEVEEKEEEDVEEVEEDKRGGRGGKQLTFSIQGGGERKART